MSALNTLNKVEQIFNITLPTEYKRWYLENDVTELFVGSDVGQPYIFEMTNWAPSILKENKVDFVLPEKSFVFFMHQGYEFCFFVCDGNNNPSVWFWNAYETKEPFQRWDSFSEYLNHWGLK